ncbi:MAG: XrtV sorting system accessory protein [Pseudomonadota bacterium]
METVYDWVTVALFAGLAVLFLQRSSEEQPRDKMVHYVPPAVGCAVANYVGNEGYMFLSVGLIVAVMAYIYLVLKPFDQVSDGEG